MANVLFGWPIYSDDSPLYTPTLSGGSWVAGLPLANLKDRRLHKVARSSTDAPADTRFRANLGVDRTARVAALINHNLSAAAKVRFLGHGASLLFAYTAGDDIVAAGGTFARTGDARYVDIDGVLRTAATGVARDGHYIGGERHMLLEDAATNLCLQSENFGTTWAAVGTPTRAAAAHTASGVSLDLLGDDDAGVLEGYTQTVTFTGDGEKAISLFVKQGSSTSSYVQIRDVTASANRMRAILTWSGGLPSVAIVGGTGTYYGYETLKDGVFRLLMATSSALLAANTNSVRVYPATTSGETTTETGTLYVGGVQAENAVIPFSYIPTTTATVTRNADSLYFTYTALPQEQTLYARGVEQLRANVAAPATSGILFIGAAAGTTDPRAFFYRPLAEAGYRFQHDPGTGSTTSNVGTAAARGDVVELRGVIGTDGAATIGVSINAAAEATNGPATAQALGVAWSDTRLYLNSFGAANLGAFAFRQVAVAAGTKTVAECRLLIYDSGWLDGLPSGTDAESRAGWTPTLAHIIPTTAPACRYWNVQIVDEANPATYVQAGRLVIAGAYQPTYNMSNGATLKWEDLSEVTDTDGGAVLVRERARRRHCELLIENLAESEVHGTPFTMEQVAGITGQLFFVFDPADTTLLWRRSFLARLRELSPIEYPHPTFHAKPFAVVEEL